jgi:hypothetical protein
MVPYCFDTSAFLNPYKRYYSFELFPSFWKGIEQRIAAGSIVTCELVRDELDQKEDSLAGWIRKQDRLIVPMDDDQQQHVAYIIPAFRAWFDTKSSRNNADPFVVALARARGLTVVSDETGGGPAKPKIPFVCAQLGVKHVSIFDYIQQTKLRFSTAH